MNAQRIGVIADTHGLLRPEAVEALQGCSLLVHAGDIGTPEILESLQRIAPVVAVRGNMDREAWCQSLPLTETVKIGQVSLYVLHELAMLELGPRVADFSAVIFGHSHQASLETRNGVIFLNPGSAGPRRFKLPVSLAIVEVSGKRLKPQLVTLM